MIALTSLLLAAVLDDVTVSAKMGDGAIEPGTEHSFTVELVLPDGMSATDSGLSSPFLQLDVPDGVTLVGTPNKQEARQFIGAPYERLMSGPTADVPFTVDDTLADDATIGVIVMAYLSHDDSRRFLRQRLELPVTPSASARAGDATNSAWGTDDTLLKIGDKVEPFAVPMAEGIDPLDLGELIGKRPIFLTTYRAFW